jgi:signal transduction histidine kinase
VRLQSRLSLITFGVLLLDGAALVSLGAWIMSGAVRDLNRQILTKEIAAKKDKIEELSRVLDNAGLADVDSYRRSVQQEIVEDFRKYRLGRTGRLVILDANGRVVLHPDFAGGTPFDPPFVREMWARHHGLIEYERAGIRRIAVFDEFPRWRWLVAISLTTDEMLERRTSYVRHAVLVALCVLMVNGLLIRTVVVRLVRRIETTLACVHAVERGDLRARITGHLPADELGKLQRGVNSMIDVLDQRTGQQVAAERELLATQDELERRVEERTAELEQAQRAALANAHAAGMAEIATDVLHNIGNAITSVSISAWELDQIAGRSECKGLLKTSALLRDNQENLARFLGDDPRGRLLFEYLPKLASALADENQATRVELARLRAGIELMAHQIHEQQEYAKRGLHVEAIELERAIEEVLDLQRAALERQGIAVVRAYGPTAAVRGQKFKLLNILLNVVKNASEAMPPGSAEPRRLWVETGEDGDGRPYLRITDNGVGITPEELPRIFQYGFTSKPEGHGFGLHFCANAMTEMGGALVAHSDGRGRGASFTLRFAREGTIPRAAFTAASPDPISRPSSGSPS